MRKNREFLQLAQVFDSAKHTIGGWMFSEKLDGQRCFWDGGLTKGMRCYDIPFANTEKHGRFIADRISTGLWSRYGQPISAPSWWTDCLPALFLDGELYAGCGNFQFVESTVKDHVGGDGWKDIRFAIFDSPDGASLFRDGKINNTNFKKEFDNFYLWILQQKKIVKHGMASQFEYVYMYLSEVLKDNRVAYPHKQQMLPFAQDKALVVIGRELDRILDLGGEGLILKKRESIWTPFRVPELLKVKPYKDDEATVIGYITGAETDKGSKLRGLMGALIVKWKDKTFKLSGFTDAERHLCYPTMPHDSSLAFVWATENPEKECPDWIECVNFKRGDTITFRYRELTDEGIPKEARYHRKVI